MPRKAKTPIKGPSAAGSGKRQLKQEGGGRKALRTFRAMSKSSRTAMKARASNRGTTLKRELRDVREKRITRGKRGVSGKKIKKLSELNRALDSTRPNVRKGGKIGARPKTKGGGKGGAGGGKTAPIRNILTDKKSRAKLRKTYGKAGAALTGKRATSKAKVTVARDRAGTAFKSKAAQAKARAGMAATDRALRYRSKHGGTEANARAATANPSFGKGFTGRKFATSAPAKKAKKRGKK